MRAGARRHLGLLLALLASAAALEHQRERQRVGYTRHDLPSFDGYVYMAMADDPAFFTAAPWGYRVLAPRLVHLFPPRRRLAAFADLAFFSLVAAGGLLFLFLRRLGHGTALSLLGVIAFALSRPVRLAVGSPMLGEPQAVALEVAVLLTVAARAPLALVAGLLALGVLAKELFLLMPPLVLMARLRGRGAARAAAATLAVAAPAGVAFWLLRWWWTPGLRVPQAPWDLALARAGLEVLALEGPETLRALLLSGVTPLAVLGALLPESRPYLKVFGYLAAATVAVSLLAWVNVPSAVPVPLFGANTERILIYALPLLLPLALAALARALRLRRGAPHAAALRAPLLAALGALLCGASLLFPLLGVDRYARLPLHAPRDGPLLMAFCAETLRVARRLARGEEVALDPREQRFAWGVDDPGRLYRMRWYLREGWGPLAHYGVDDVVMREPRATLVLPSLGPDPLEVVLSFGSAEPGALQAFLNGERLGRVATGRGAPESVLRVPRGALFRGDNLLTLQAADGVPGGARLRSVRLRPPG